MATTSSISIETTPIIFDAAYKGDEIKQRAAQILGLTNFRGWSVVDTYKDLALIHYDDTADPSEFGWLRGCLIDLKTGEIRAKSFGYTPTVVASELTVEDGVINLLDMDNQPHSFGLATSTLKIAYEGVVFRIIWYESEMLFVTHRKIRPHKSRWGNSPTFPEMYEAARGPPASELFDLTKPFSTSCYVILVVHPALLVATRQRINAPYIVLLAHHQMESSLDSSLTGPGVSSFPFRTALNGLVSEPCLLDPPALSLEQANKHLRNGYYKEFAPDDPRMGMGEALILYRMDGDDVVDVVKIHSPSYEWRSYLRGNNPNIWNQFFKLLNLVRKDIQSEDDWVNLEKKLVMFSLYDESALRDYFARNKMILTFPRGPRSYQANKNEYRHRDNRIHLLWINFVISLPAHLQAEALEFLTQYKQIRAEVTKWLQEVERKERDFAKLELSDRAKGLMTTARQLARQTISNGENSNRKNSNIKLPTLIKSIIRNLINKEDGPSLYRLSRELKFILNPRVSLVGTSVEAGTSAEASTNAEISLESPATDLEGVATSSQQ